MNGAITYKKILMYLLQPEDTTETGGQGGGADCLLLLNDYPWLGTFKSIFWIMVAVIGPLASYLLLALYG